MAAASEREDLDHIPSNFHSDITRDRQTGLHFSPPKLLANLAANLPFSNFYRSLFLVNRRRGPSWLLNQLSGTAVCPTAVAADYLCDLWFRIILPNNRSNSSTTSLQYPDGPSRTETLVITVAIAEIMN